jgi:hypothetical protein
MSVGNVSVHGLTSDSKSIKNSDYDFKNRRISVNENVDVGELPDIVITRR